MIDPSPTTQIDPTLARLKLIEIIEQTATKPAYLVFSVDNSDYKLHLEPSGGSLPSGISDRIGDRIVGRIRATAKRIDEVRSGGKFVDPVFGKPRRVQGRVISSQPSDGTVTIQAGVPFTCKVSAPGQRAGQFETMSFVACELSAGANFAEERSGSSE